MASSTCEGTMEPTMQAEPLEAQMPSRSRLMSSPSPSSPGKADVEGIGEGMLRGAVPPRVRTRGEHALPKAVAQGRLPRTFCARIRQGQVRSHGHACDGRHIFRPGAAIIFMGAAMLQALEGNPGAHPEEAGTLRPVKFVGRERDGVKKREVERLFSERLHRVRVQQDAVPAAERGDGPQVLNDARFVIRRHDGGEYRFAGKGLRETPPGRGGPRRPRAGS